MKAILGIFVAGALTVLSASSVLALDVKVPVKSKYEASQEYPLELLRFVLDKSGVPYRVVFSEVGITTQARQISLLKENQDINLGWFGTSAELERDLVPIRFPIWRGLLGYRVFIINKNQQAQFDQVNTLQDLSRFTGEQGIGWSDIQILEHSGLKQKASPYDLIFAKIDAGRSDYFSRGITEAFREVAVRRTEFPNLAVEKHVLLVYPFDGFFFTNKENGELARALESGFQKAYQDGSFTKFFYGHPVVKMVLETAQLEKRTKIEIPNLLMTAETLAIPDLYWHKP